jgi:predicted kinase
VCKSRCKDRKIRLLRAKESGEEKRKEKVSYYQPPMFPIAHNKLVIIRGVPGSGKTTLANTKYPEYVRCEADDYEGLYTGGFHPEMLSDAHKFCQKKARKYLTAGKDVVVSNTSLQLWEMTPYILMARELDIPWENIIVEDATYAGVSVHNVPEEKVKEMKRRYQVVDKPVSEIDWASYSRRGR